MPFCSNCGNDLQLNAAYCSVCGSKASFAGNSFVVSETNITGQKVKQVTDSVTNKFCRNCGKEVAANAFACLGCGLPPIKGRNYCSLCGSTSHPEAIICVKCGGSLTSSSGYAGNIYPQTSTTGVRTSRPIILSILCLLTFILGGIGVIGIMSNFDEISKQLGDSGAVTYALLSGIVSIISCVGIWNMKKWGAYIYIGVSVIGLLVSISDGSMRMMGGLAAISLGITVLFVGSVLYHFNKMTN